MNLEWSGSDGFTRAKDYPWKSKITGRDAGEFRMFDKLAFLKVYEAGHMVPYDQYNCINVDLSMRWSLLTCGYIGVKKFNKMFEELYSFFI